MSVSPSFLTLVINFNVGYQVKGLLVMQRRKIAKNYLRHWFAVDFLAAIPMNMALVNQSKYIKDFSTSDFFYVITNEYHPEGESSVLNLNKDNYQFRLAIAFNFFLVLRLLKVLKLGILLNKVQDLIISDVTEIFFKFLRLMITTFLIAHWISCVFWVVGLSQIYTNHENWIVKRGLIDVEPLEQYVQSVYWAITTMCTVGYGDITPETSLERVFAMANMIVAAGMFAYIIGDIGTMISKYNELAEKYE